MLRRVGRPTLEWLKFLSLQALGRLVRIIVMLDLWVRDMVRVTRWLLCLVVSGLQLGVQLKAIVCLVTVPVVAAMWAGPIRESFEFRKCGRLVKVLTKVIAVFGLSGRTLLPANRMESRVVVCCVRLLRLFKPVGVLLVCGSSVMRLRIWLVYVVIRVGASRFLVIVCRMVLLKVLLSLGTLRLTLVCIFVIWLPAVF